MGSAWIEHAKRTHAKLGGSYSAALKAASKTWKKGGSADKKVKKVKKKRENN